MALITTYDTLKSEIASELDRADLTSDIPRFIQLAESGFRADHDLKRRRVSTIVVDAETVSVPSGYKSTESISWPGDGVYVGELNVSTPADLNNLTYIYGTGRPRSFTYHNGMLRFGPVPDTSYSMVHTWWEDVPNLSASAQTNWLITLAPSLYFYASLLHSAPHLREDTRIGVWQDYADRELGRVKHHLMMQPFSGPVSLPSPYAF